MADANGPLTAEERAQIEQDLRFCNPKEVLESHIRRLLEAYDWQARMVEALETKMDGMQKAKTCGCQVDGPDDICMHHSPAVLREKARADKAEATAAQLSLLLRQAQEQIDAMRNLYETTKA